MNAVSAGCRGGCLSRASTRAGHVQVAVAVKVHVQVDGYDQVNEKESRWEQAEPASSDAESAEEKGFEPLVVLPLRRFSKPLP